MYQILEELLYQNLISCHSHIYYENWEDISLNHFPKLSLKWSCNRWEPVLICLSLFLISAIDSKFDPAVISLVLVLCTFNLRPVSYLRGTEISDIHEHYIPLDTPYLISPLCWVAWTTLITVWSLVQLCNTFC